MATIVPARASAVPGRFRFAFALVGGLPTLRQLDPTGGARSDFGVVRFAVAPGTRLPATCTPSACVPSDGSVALLGGFDLVDGRDASQ